MYAILATGWLLIGFIFILASKDFLMVCACFLLFGIFSGLYEMNQLRKEIDIKELKNILERISNKDE